MVDISNAHDLGDSTARWLALGARTQAAWMRLLTGRRSRFEARSFVCAEGSRDYRLHVPARPPRALLVMLHGCTQTAEDFAQATGMGDQAELHGLVVAYPEQTRTHHRMACWSWYRPRHQRRGTGEPAILAGLTQALMAEFAIDADRVFVAGLSAGGAMAAVLGETYPDLFAAVGVHSGLPCGVAVNLPSALGAMRGGAWTSSFRPTAPARRPMRTIVIHGAGDETVHPANAKRIAAAALGREEVHIRRETATSRGGRPYAVTTAATADGTPLSESWLIEGLGHAWSGGSPDGTFTDPSGPNASAGMVRFFLQGDRLRAGREIDPLADAGPDPRIAI